MNRSTIILLLVFLTACGDSIDDKLRLMTGPLTYLYMSEYIEEGDYLLEYSQKTSARKAHRLYDKCDDKTVTRGELAGCIRYRLAR